MALFGFFGGGSDKATKAFYSIENLQHLYNRLQHVKDTDEQNRDAMVEVIRQITEALIWGEHNGHDHNFFDFFCEKNILAHFVQVLGLPRVPKTVKVQLLQTLSMLVQNIRRDTSLYYLFSNNYVNQLISTQFDWNDEEILGYYISFLKSLALKLNGETIKFFFNEISQQFPLYVEAVRFFGHREQMVRTAVRTLTLQVYSIQDSAMQKFVLERSKVTYFTHLACHLREMWLQIDEAANRAASGAGDQAGTLQELSEQHQDLLMYLSDVLELEVPALGEALVECMLNFAFFPALLGSLLSQLQVNVAMQQGCEASAETRSAGCSMNGKEATGQFVPSSNCGPQSPAGGSSALAPAYPVLSPACSLFILHQVFDTMRSKVLLEPLATALLRPILPTEIVGSCLGPVPAPPATYKATNSDVCGPPSAAGAASAQVQACASEKELVPGASEGVLPSPAPRASQASRGFPFRANRDGGAAPEASVRSCLLSCLRAPTDASVLLTAGVLQACLRSMDALPRALLEESRFLPSTRQSKFNELLGNLLSDSIGATGGIVDDDGQSDPGRSHEKHPFEVLLHVIRALERQTSFRVVVIQSLALLAIELASVPAVHGRASWVVAPINAVRHAVRSAARHVRTYLHGTLSDSFLDMFAEEWELHCAHTVGIREACNSIRCLLPVSDCTGAAPEWLFPTSHSERQHAAKAIRGLLIIRRLASDLLRCLGQQTCFQISPPTSVGMLGKPKKRQEEESAANNDSPFIIAGETEDGYQEGRGFELRRADRVVCQVIAPDGRHTRYLMLHSFVLLLVQPDLASPGCGVVKTLAAVRQVEPQIDRNDQRTLRLGIRLARGSQCPGEASPYDPATADLNFRLPPEEHRGSSFFMLTLSFEDHKRCQCANDHLRARRAQVRAELRSRVEAFVDGLCSQEA